MRHIKAISNMPGSHAFRHIFHADWSMTDRKRWVASAHRDGASWRVQAPHLVGESSGFVSKLFQVGQGVLAGFDFPIGLPRYYGENTGLPDFLTALSCFGTGEWSDFFNVARSFQDIGLKRPFYPHCPTVKTKQPHLLAGLNCPSIDLLLRDCERATSSLPKASPLFWTVGAKQVGKGAIAGWREVIRPARSRGAKLWPFDGNVADLADSVTPVLAETYPAEAYGHAGMKFGHGMSKQRQDDRQTVMAVLQTWAEEREITFSSDLQAQIKDGFGGSKTGEDPFDSLAGALSMIEVAMGRRRDLPPALKVDRWEGWILGRSGEGSPEMTKTTKPAPFKSDLRRFCADADDVDFYSKGKVTQKSLLTPEEEEENSDV